MISHKKRIKKICELYHDSGIVTTENNTFSEEHELLCTSSKQKNEAKIKIDFDGLIKVRNPYPNHPIIEYLNINTLQNKIISLREIIAKTPFDVFCVDETKIHFKKFAIPALSHGSKLKRRWVGSCFTKKKESLLKD